MTDIPIKAMFIAPTNGGKTHLSATFPKSYFLITEPSGEETWFYKPELKKNIVKHKYFIPESPEDTKRVFEELTVSIKEAKDMQAKGEIETLVLDNCTYLAENRFIYINKYEPNYTKDGKVDIRATYGSLGRWLYEFVYMNLLTFKGNVVLTFHEELESDEVMEKKPDKSNPIVPSVLGSFRDKVGGMFSYVFFLSKVPQGQGKYKYLARTNIGQGKLAKSRIELPEIIESVSYETIIKAREASLSRK